MPNRHLNTATCTAENLNEVLHRNPLGVWIVEVGIVDGFLMPPDTVLHKVEHDDLTDRYTVTVLHSTRNNTAIRATFRVDRLETILYEVGDVRRDPKD